MMHTKRLLSVLVLAVTFVSGNGMTVAADAKAENPKAVQAQQEIDEADKARKMAASVDSEWTTTGKLIKKAQAALKQGDYDTAIRLAKQAGEEGVIAYEQGASQKELRIPSYLKY
jgi:hypothetical protein